MLSLDVLAEICYTSKRSTLEPFVGPLEETFQEFRISTPECQGAFIPQSAHESGGFRYREELATGEAYEGRLDLGNDQPGEGVRYKGRGIFQLTGEFNYRKAGLELFLDEDWFAMNPALAAEPAYSCRIAGWYWTKNGLNELAAQCSWESYRKITRRINGGYNGWADRAMYYKRAARVLGFNIIGVEM